ncbi:MAG TPA: FmdE family protein [Terracidiphilus sp.]|nr:FmdE family protein [Terracidiphilus sp.]
MMDSLDELLERAKVAHGHLCAGQILGVRMGLFGLERLGEETGLRDPLGADRKRLITFVEIDRCATDAIALVTGCRLGKRALKFRDWGKMAATFVDLESGRGVRVVAREDSRELASRLYPHLENRNLQQMQAYRELSDADLFGAQRVRVAVDPADLPGYKAQRAVCSCCGEGVNFGRFVETAGQQLCLSCAHPELRYWQPDDPQK